MNTEIFKLKNSLLGFEFFIVCFGATVLVPLLTGIPTSVVLFTAGISTLMMHYFAKGEYGSPIVFLGSSFAYIAPILYIQEKWSMGAVFFSLGIAGLGKILFSRLIKKVGNDFIVENLFPPVVSGTMILLIGLTLVNTGLDMASSNWWIASITLISLIGFMSFTKGFTNLFSILLAVIVGYGVSLLSGNVEIGNFSILQLPQFSMPVVNFEAALYMLPFSLVPIAEHFGDIYAVSEATGNKYYKSPGMHRTMLIDGLGTMLSLVGSVPNTTYSEGTATVNLLKIKDAKITRNAGLWALVFSFLGILSALLESIPTAVIGGIMIILFGSIATIGLKSMIKNKVNFDNHRNIIVASIMLVFGLGNVSIWIFNGLGLAAILGVLLQFSFYLFDKFKKEWS